MNKIITYILLIFFFIVIGCAEKIDQSMVIGKYQANHNKSTDTLEVLADGTYIYKYKMDDGKYLTNNNTWEFKYLDNKPTIIFSSFIFGLPGYGTKKPGFWFVEVEKAFRGNVRLYIDRDLNYYYSKVQ
jgi:hypothetical protein